MGSTIFKAQAGPTNRGVGETLTVEVAKRTRGLLGGLAGLRNCEIIRAYPGDPVIEWTDVLWDNHLIWSGTKSPN
jgi:hypothetical protein